MGAGEAERPVAAAGQDRARGGVLFGLLAAAPDAIVVIDERGEIAALNELTETMFGYPAGELVGLPVEVLLPERLRGGHVAHREAYAADPRTRTMGEGRELAGRRKDGSEFPVEISLSPLEDRGRHLVISIIRDLSQRREADARFRNLLESAPDGIVVADRSGTITLVNGQTEAMFGYRRAELVGRPVEILVPERYRQQHAGHRDGYFAAPRTRPMGAGQLLTGRRKDGSEFPVEISLSLLDGDRGGLVTSIIRDMTDRRVAEEALRASLREKEVLLKEIHHRVKNNLQVTSSLLRLQSAYLTDPLARAMFAASQDRLRSMALVHEKLYQSGDLSRIDLTDYLESLARLLFGSYAVEPGRIELVVSGANLYLPVDLAVPCGLIANELVSNCLKHAFPGERAGRVEVRVSGGPADTVGLAVADDGIGLDPSIDVHRTETLGLELVRTLSEQLGATLEVDRRRGTEVRVTFPEVRR